MCSKYKRLKIQPIEGKNVSCVSGTGPVYKIYSELSTSANILDIGTVNPEFYIQRKYSLERKEMKTSPAKWRRKEFVTQDCMREMRKEVL